MPVKPVECDFFFGPRGELADKFSGANGVSFLLESLGKQTSHTYKTGFLTERLNGFYSTRRTDVESICRAD